MRTIAKHRVAVGDLEYFRQAMRNIDDALAFGLKPRDRGKQLLSFFLANRRCRLVHEDHFGIVAERLGDLHQLHLRHGQVHHVLIGADMKFQPVEQRLCVPVHRLKIDAAETGRRLAAEIDVFRHGHMRNRAQFLLDDGNAGGKRLSRTVELHLFATPPDLAAVALVDTHQDGKKRRFAGTVAAAERMH